jgi:hypothetical protein
LLFESHLRGRMVCMSQWLYHTLISCSFLSHLFIVISYASENSRLHLDRL